MLSVRRARAGSAMSAQIRRFSQCQVMMVWPSQEVEVCGLGVITELPADAAASGVGRMQPCAVEVQI